MDAAEARAIADRVAAKQAVIGYLHAIESAAKGGEYEYRFGHIDDKEVKALTLLGFKVILDGPKYRVCWGHADLH